MVARRRLHLLIAASTVAIWACSGPFTQDEGGADGGPHEDLRAELMHSIANYALAPSFANFANSAAMLESTSAAHRDAIGGEDEATAALAAQDAWRDTMSSWQVLEMMQLGPAGSSSKAIGGADLRDEIYSWPSVNNCRVDQEIVLGEYEDPDFITTRLVNAYGLDALEYLLFYTGAENTCAPQLPINAEGEWAALDAAALAMARASYAAALAQHISAQATELAQSWAPQSGEFTVYLADPRAADSPYENLPIAMDEILRVMFYLDTTVKDDKLAVPAGILECASAPCIDDLESGWAHESKAQVLANLEAFRLLYLGGEDGSDRTGFDDLLRAFDEAELAEQMRADIDAAIETVSAVEGSFADALATDPSSLDASHAAVRKITDALKGDFATVLMLTIPNEAAGDAD